MYIKLIYCYRKTTHPDVYGPKIKELGRTTNDETKIELLNINK